MTEPVFHINQTAIFAGPIKLWDTVEPELVVSLNGTVPQPWAMAYGFDAGFALPFGNAPKAIVIHWPDMGVPRRMTRDDWLALIGIVQTFPRVYIGCTAGLGRTGTALAVMAGLHGISQTPIAFVRDRYNSQAIETWEQMDYVRTITGYDEAAIALFDCGLPNKRQALEAFIASLPDAIRAPDGPYQLVSGHNNVLTICGTGADLSLNALRSTWHVRIIGKYIVESEYPQSLTASRLCKQWVANEQAVLALCRALGVSPIAVRSYTIGDITIRNGVYYSDHSPLTLEQAVAMLKEDEVDNA